MSAVLALVIAAGLAAAAAGPPEPDSVVSPLDVPGHANRVVVSRPDRDGDRVVCRSEPAPDSHLPQRICARQRDRDALAAEQQRLIIEKQHVCDIVGAC